MRVSKRVLWIAMMAGSRCRAIGSRREFFVERESESTAKDAMSAKELIVFCLFAAFAFFAVNSLVPSAEQPELLLSSAERSDPPAERPELPKLRQKYADTCRSAPLRRVPRG